MNLYVAVAVLLSVPLLGLLAYMHRLGPLFCVRSRVMGACLGLVILVQLVVSLGVKDRDKSFALTTPVSTTP